MFASMGSLAQIVLLHTVGLNLDRTYSGPHLDPKMLTLNVSHTRSRVDGAKQSQPPLLVCIVDRGQSNRHSIASFSP